MKKLLLALTVLLTFTLFACEVTTEKTDYRDMMTEIEPKKVEVSFFTDNYATYEFKMNETQTLYYCPEKVMIGNNIYINDKTGYFIITIDGFSKSSKKVDLSYLKLLFSSESEWLKWQS